MISHTDPKENLFSYQPWYLKRGNGWQEIQFTNWQRHNKGLIAQIQGIENREQARELTGENIYTDDAQLPDLEPGEYYWKDLVGLSVINKEDKQLGKVSHLLETGSNDVLVVKPNADSIDDQERLIPYVPEQFILDINLADSILRVDWDADF